MGRAFSGKPVRDTEIAAETMIDPTMLGKPAKLNINSYSRLTVVENQQEVHQMDTLNEKKN